MASDISEKASQDLADLEPDLEGSVAQVHHVDVKYHAPLLEEKRALPAQGYAIKRGLEECSFNKVLIIDADMSVDISQIEKSWFSQDESLIIGSRKIGIQKGTPVRRQFAGNFLNSLIRKVFKLNIYDTQCGFKFLNSEKVKIISSQLTVDGFMYDLDLIMIEEFSLNLCAVIK